MRIVYVLPFAPPATQYGGPVTQVDMTAPELARRGHDVRLVGSDLNIDPALPREQWVERHGYHIWYARRPAWGYPAPYHLPRAALGLQSALPGADVVHLQLGLTLLNRLALQHARAAGVPCIYAPRGSLCPLRLRDKRLVKWFFLRLVERPLLRQVAACHALTEKERADLHAQGVEDARIHIIPNAVPAGDPAQWPTQAQARERLGWAADEQVVLFLGQVLAIKGLDLLITAVAELRDRFPRLRLVVAGPDAGYEQAARALVRRHQLDERVRFLGYVTGAHKREVFRAADLFALISHSEGLPNAVLEACALERPVLISTACQVPQVATADAGRVIPASQTETTAALADMLSDPTRMQAMGQRALELSRTEFSVTRTVDRLEALYQQVAARREGKHA